MVKIHASSCALILITNNTNSPIFRLLISGDLGLKEIRINV